MASLVCRIIALLTCLVCARAFALAPFEAGAEAEARWQVDQHQNDAPDDLPGTGSTSSDSSDPDDESDDDLDDEAGALTSHLAVSRCSARESTTTHPESTSRRPSSIDCTIEPPPPRQP